MQGSRAGHRTRVPPQATMWAWISPHRTWRTALQGLEGGISLERGCKTSEACTSTLTPTEWAAFMEAGPVRQATQRTSIHEEWCGVTELNGAPTHRGWVTPSSESAQESEDMEAASSERRQALARPPGEVQVNRATAREVAGDGRGSIARAISSTPQRLRGEDTGQKPQPHDVLRQQGGTGDWDRRTTAAAAVGTPPTTAGAGRGHSSER